MPYATSKIWKAGFDVERGWGKRPSVPGLCFTKWSTIGHNRVGPDLANVGLREYLWMASPTSFHAPKCSWGSICQPSPFLYEQVEEPTDKTIETSIGGEPIFIKPSIRADRLVAYLEALKQDYELPEMAFIDTQDEEVEDVIRRKSCQRSYSFSICWSNRFW